MRIIGLNTTQARFQASSYEYTIHQTTVIEYIDDPARWVVDTLNHNYKNSEEIIKYRTQGEEK